MKFYIKENDNLVEIQRKNVPVLKPDEVYIESNSLHEGEHIDYIMEQLNIQKELYTEKIKEATEKSIYYYIGNIKVFTDFNGKLIFV